MVATSVGRGETPGESDESPAPALRSSASIMFALVMPGFVPYGHEGFPVYGSWLRTFWADSSGLPSALKPGKPV